jgi:acetyl esterase/lipase
MEAALPACESVSRADYHATSHDGARVLLRWYADNYTGWHALLGDLIGQPDVPAYAAPARAVDLSGLPPTYIEVGELDIFRDEAIEYARRIALTGTSVELHVHPGCPHGFDRISAQADVVRRARADRLRFLSKPA